MRRRGLKRGTRRHLALRHGKVDGTTKPFRQLRCESLESRLLLSQTAPEISWATYLGGNGSDQVFAIASDSAGNSYVTGQTTSTNLPQATNAPHGGQDAFVAKMRADGSVAWTTYLGGSGTDGYAKSGIAVDAQGYVVICTTTWSTDFSGATNTAHSGGDSVVAKLNFNGELQWAAYVGGSSFEYGSGVAVDNNGNIFTGGYTGSSDFASAVGSLGGPQDAFVAKLNSDGTLQRATYVGGPGIEGGHDLALDLQGNPVITGMANSGGLPLCTDSFHGGPYDAFVAKVSSTDGSLLWSTYVGGSSDDQGYGIAVDRTDKIFVTGYAYSIDLASATNTPQGGRDAFVTRLTAAGSLDWTTYLGGTDVDEGYGVALDNSGNAYVRGNASSTNFLLAAPNQHHGSVDSFVTKVAPNGVPRWTTLLGGSSYDGAYGVALDATGNVLVPGWTNSPDLQGATNQLQGSEDGFVVKLDVTDNNVTPSRPVLSLSATTIFENGKTVLSGTFTDPDVLDDHTVSIAWGDGTSETIAIAANVLTFSQPHQYLDNHPDNEPYTITAIVTDKNTGISAPASIDVTVRNVAPTAPKQPWFSGATNVPVGAAPTCVISEDFNRDGWSDLVTVNQVGNSISVRLGRQNGTFTDEVALATGGVGSGFGATGDFNGDGFMDFATANVSSNNVSILLGNGSGAFGAPATITVGVHPTWVTAVNYDGDANTDLLVVNEFGDSLTVLKGLGDGTFTPESSVSVADDPYQVTAADFNQDGSLDLAVSHGFGEVSFITRNAPAIPSQQVGWGAIGIIATDVNNDGWKDVVTANSYDHSVSVLVNDRLGSFREEIRHPVPVDSRALVAADFDGDTIADLAVASWAEGSVSVLKGNGDGTFQARRTFSAGSGPSSIATMDGNHDGVLDLAVANRYSDNVTLLFNDMLSLTQNGPVNEGSPVTVSFGSPHDPSPVDTAAGFHYAFALESAQLPTLYTEAATVSTAQFTFADNGTYTVYGRVFDKDNGHTDYHTTVTVNNLAPSEIRLNLSAATIDEGDSTTLSGSFVDPGVLDTHTVQIEWGDGSTPTTLELAAGVTSIPATTHQYLDNPSGQPNGSFPISVTVLDKDGDSGSVLGGTGPEGTAWAIYLGGSEVDHAFAIVSDTAGNAYVTGYTSSTNLPQATNASRGGQDAFVAKVRADGSLAWTTYLGGDGWEGQGKLSIAVDARGNLFVDGWTGSSTFEGVPTGPGGSAYVAKLGPDGSVARVAILDGSQIEFGAGVAVAPDGSVFVSGATRSDSFSGLVMGETLLGSYSGVWDMFVAKLDSSLNVTWLRYLGGIGEDQALSVVADNAGNAIITGGSTSGGGGGLDGVVASVLPMGGFNLLTDVGRCPVL